MTNSNQPGRLKALDRLMSAIHARTEAGEYVPCIDPARGHLWLSEGAAEREAAAHGCGICPALTACATYVEAHPEPSGVWAGKFTAYRSKAVTK